MVYKLRLFLVVLALGSTVNFAFAETKTDNKESDQQVNDFSLSGFGEKGKKSWDLSGKSADIFNDVIKLKSVLGNLYEENEKIQLTADKGDFNKASGLVHLEDNVVITTLSGARLTSDTLDWDRKHQMVSTVSRINLQREGMTLVGQGAKGHSDLKNIEIEKDVRLDILSQDKTKTKSEKITITCLGPLDIDYQKNIAVFNDNVKVERPDSTIYSDKLEVYFNMDKGTQNKQAVSGVTANSIDHIIALGNVRILEGENVSYSEKAIYTAADRKLSLTGRPQLVIYQTEKMNNAAFGN